MVFRTTQLGVIANAELGVRAHAELGVRASAEQGVIANVRKLHKLRKFLKQINKKYENNCVSLHVGVITNATLPYVCL